MSAEILDLDPYIAAYRGKSVKVFGQEYRLKNPSTIQGFNLALRMRELATRWDEMDLQEAAERFRDILTEFSQISGLPLDVLERLDVEQLNNVITFIYSSPDSASGQPGSEGSTSERNASPLTSQS